MSAFHYRDGQLWAEDVAIERLAQVIGTPLYIYSSAVLEARYRAYAEAFAGRPALICYAVKANHNQAVIATLAALGAGADIVSEGELHRALAAGVDPKRIVFSGVGKTPQEMTSALNAGILQFNVESDGELVQLSRVAAAQGKTAPVALRINPGVDAHTHAKITTGTAENKFGVDIDEAAALAQRAMRLPGLRFEGLAVHIGSQLTSLGPYRAAFAKIAELARSLITEGCPIRRLDIGGGLGVAYGDEKPLDPAAYRQVVDEALGDLPVELVCEPGRYLVADAGVLVTRVLYVKHGRAKRFVIVDTGMNDLLRPALYDGHHPVQLVREPAWEAEWATVDVVGPLCESGDVIAVARELPALQPGDLIAVGLAGAYGAAMASSYNSRPPAPEVMVRGDAYAVVRPRLSYEELIGFDRLPSWLDRPAAPRTNLAR